MQLYFEHSPVPVPVRLKFCNSFRQAELKSVEISAISVTIPEIYAKEVNFFKTVNLGVKLVNIINSFLDTMFLSGTESCKYLE